MNLKNMAGNWSWGEEYIDLGDVYKHMLTGFTKGIKWKKEKTRESEPHVRWEEYELEKEWTKKKKKKVEEKEGTNTDNLRASTLKKKQVILQST